jgi:hypothetical protein
MKDRFIGLDIHKATVAVAIAEDGRRGEIRHYGTVKHQPADIAKLINRLAGKGSALHFCYEAGPCGYGLYRQIINAGHSCIVVAPRPCRSSQVSHQDRSARCQEPCAAAPGGRVGGHLGSRSCSRGDPRSSERVPKPPTPSSAASNSCFRFYCATDAPSLVAVSGPEVTSHGSPNRSLSIPPTISSVRITSARYSPVSNDKNNLRS